MNVQAAQARHIQHGLRQDQAIGDDDGDVGIQRSEVLLHIDAAQRDGVTDGQTQRLGPQVDRAFPLGLAAPGGAGRLAIDRDDLMRGVQRVQHRNRKFRRAHEHQPHARFASLSARAISIFRFKADRWSKYILPARWSIWCWTEVAQRLTKSRSSSAPSAFR